MHRIRQLVDPPVSLRGGHTCFAFGDYHGQSRHGRQRLQDLSHAGHMHRAARQKEGHVRPHLCGDLALLLQGHAAAQQPVESSDYRSSIGAAAAQSRLGGNVLFNVNVNAIPAMRMLQKQLCRLVCDIFLIAREIFVGAG